MTHQKNDKRMTKEREVEIRTPCIGYEPQEHVKELLAELDAVRNAAGAIAIDNRFEIVDLRKERDEFLAELDAARSELDEQCRLNGKLMSQVQEKDKEIERLKASLECRGVHTCHEQCLKPQCVMRRELDALRETLRKKAQQ